MKTLLAGTRPACRTTGRGAAHRDACEVRLDAGRFAEARRRVQEIPRPTLGNNGGDGVLKFHLGIIPFFCLALGVNVRVDLARLANHPGLVDREGMNRLVYCPPGITLATLANCCNHLGMRVNFHTGHENFNDKENDQPRLFLCSDSVAPDPGLRGLKASAIPSPGSGKTLMCLRDRVLLELLHWFVCGSNLDNEFIAANGGADSESKRRIQWTTVCPDSQPICNSKIVDHRSPLLGHVYFDTNQKRGELCIGASEYHKEGDSRQGFRRIIEISTDGYRVSP